MKLKNKGVYKFFCFWNDKYYSRQYNARSILPRKKQ